MIKFENTEVTGWKSAIRGMRNPMNSWDKSDSAFDTVSYEDVMTNSFKLGNCNNLGTNDLTLMEKLAKAGTDHRKFMRMIVVYVDITAPLYWWKEFDTYKVGTVANSCSTMHKIHDKEFTLDDFSCEMIFNGVYDVDNFEHFKETLNLLNRNREMFLKTKDKVCWWQMIQLLPSSYNQKRTVMLNYEVLANIYKSRKNHKLDEWSVDFIEWIESLPYSEIIIGE